MDPHRAWPTPTKPLGEFLLCDFRFDLWRESVKSKGVNLRFVGPRGERRLVDFSFKTLSHTQEKEEYVLCVSSFATGGRKYACTPEGLRRGAIKRLLGVRENNPAYHQGLVEAQERLCTDGRMSHFVRWYKTHLPPMEDYDELVYKWLVQPHPLRALRLKNAKGAQRLGWMWYDHRSYVDYKLKPEEILADGKQLRCIGEISNLSAFELGPLADVHKKVFTSVYSYRKCGMKFIAGPSEEEMTAAFDFLEKSSQR